MGLVNTEQMDGEGEVRLSLCSKDATDRGEYGDNKLGDSVLPGDKVDRTAAPRIQLVLWQYLGKLCDDLKEMRSSSSAFVTGDGSEMESNMRCLCVILSSSEGGWMAKEGTMKSLGKKILPLLSGGEGLVDVG